MKKIKVGIIANEFFDAKINRVGGFGWAARRAVDAFRGDARFAPPVFFSGESLGPRRDLTVDGTRIVLPSPRRLSGAFAAWREHVDVLLCIDYRPKYLRWLRAMPFTPGIVWVRDPRTPEDMARIRSLRIPGSDAAPGGVTDFDFKSLARFIAQRRYFPRRIVLASKMAYMRDKIPGTFGLPPSDLVLPNPDVVDYRGIRIAKSPRPTVVFLGRLDPVKRPWLFIELARQFPAVDFLMLGQGFITGDAGWRPVDVPGNVQLMGQVFGQAKLDVLSAAWVLVNTSIHEESAVSMMEALAYEVPIIGFIESDGLAARFGCCLGYDTGTGYDSLPKLAAALKELLEDGARRNELGRRGRAWVTGEHNTPSFLESFLQITATLKGKKAPTHPAEGWAAAAPPPGRTR